MLRVPGTQILHKTTNEGFLVSDDNGLNWHFTFRGENEFKQMHKTAIKIPEVGDLVRDKESLEDEEREIFGETLDEPLPEDFVLYWL